MTALHPDRTVRPGYHPSGFSPKVTGLRHRLATFAIIEYQARRRPLAHKAAIPSTHPHPGPLALDPGISQGHLMRSAATTVDFRAPRNHSIQDLIRSGTG
jgi:hypothetical protein